MKISMCVIQKMSYSITFSWTLHHRSISFKFVLVLKRTDFYEHIIIPLRKQIFDMSSFCFYAHLKSLPK